MIYVDLLFAYLYALYVFLLFKLTDTSTKFTIVRFDFMFIVNPRVSRLFMICFLEVLSVVLPFQFLRIINHLSLCRHIFSFLLISARFLMIHIISHDYASSSLPIVTSKQ